MKLWWVYSSIPVRTPDEKGVFKDLFHIFVNDKLGMNALPSTTNNFYWDLNHSPFLGEL